MISGTLVIDSGTGRRRASLADYLPPELEETAVTAANTWIKELRHAVVDGQPMRRRFTYRGDSLWWFTELYLHKTQVIEDLFRTILAVEEVMAREHPLEIHVETGGRLARGIAPQVAAARGIRYRGTRGFGPSWSRLARLDARARGLHVAALASRLTRRAAPPELRPVVAAFVHRAFWKTDGSDGSAESYIGPVLVALEQILPHGALAYLGVGPTENFAARRWWRARIVSSGPRALVPIERFAPLGSLDGSRRLWRERYRLRRALWGSTDLRQRAIIRGCDCWAVIREELAGVALLQWPWSARAMDEAAAALDALRPKAALTYAEAGGWGRALVLEARRAGVPSIGLQHGFIYRHWLNYRHERDEVQPDPGHPADVGFPAPTLTLLFDDYAVDHLTRAGHFPRSSLAVTGSARLDGLAAAARTLSDEDLARARAAVTGTADGRFVLLVTKYRQARSVLPALVEATRAAGVTLAIKTHPAETPAVYASAAEGGDHVVVIPSADPLAPLLRAAGALVTVNSTVALDAAVLGVPALVIGLPNNLSPFVEAGIMAGTADPEAIGTELRRILYDQGFLDQLGSARGAFLDRFGMRPDGRAAERAAEMVVRLTENGSRCAS
jgi:hypothetical protein